MFGDSLFQSDPSIIPVLVWLGTVVGVGVVVVHAQQQTEEGTGQERLGGTKRTDYSTLAAGRCRAENGKGWVGR